MGGKDSNYTIVYRCDTLARMQEGGWVIFQRAKAYGGGFWLGRTYNDCFWLEFDKPTCLSDAITYIISYSSMLNMKQGFDDEFRLV